MRTGPSLCLATALSVATQVAESTRTISVRGHAEAQAAPDRPWGSAGVVSQGPTASDVLDKNSAAMPGVFAALRTAGITDADIGTTDFNVLPGFNDVNRWRQAPRIVAYRVSNTAKTLVQNTGAVGATLDALIMGGANTLHGVLFLRRREWSNAGPAACWSGPKTRNARRR